MNFILSFLEKHRPLYFEYAKHLNSGYSQHSYCDNIKLLKELKNRLNRLSPTEEKDIKLHKGISEKIDSILTTQEKSREKFADISPFKKALLRFFFSPKPSHDFIPKELLPNAEVKDIGFYVCLLEMKAYNSSSSINFGGHLKTY